MTLPDPIIGPGIYYDVPDAGYRAAPGVAQSSLKPILRSPAHYAAALMAERKESAAMLQGQVFHQMTLAPCAPVWWTVRPEGIDGRTKEGKAWLAGQNGKTIITQAEFDQVFGAMQAVMNDPNASMALDCGYAEVSCWAPFRKFGIDIMRKCRIDFVNDGPSLIDLKLTDDARESAWSSKIEGFGYHIQAAYYLDIMNDLLEEAGEPLKEAFIYIVVERDLPHGVKVYRLDDEAVAIGRGLYVKGLALLHRCEEEAKWPAYGRNVTRIGLPRWATRDATQIYGWPETLELPAWNH